MEVFAGGTSESNKAVTTPISGDGVEKALLRLGGYCVGYAFTIPKFSGIDEVKLLLHLPRNIKKNNASYLYL